MSAANSQNLPELFLPDDARWASRAAARGEIRRLARGLYSTNLDEPAEQLLRRRWYDVAALYFPGAVVVDRSAAVSGPAADGSLFLDVGPRPVNPRRVELPGLTLRPRNGPGPVPGDLPFMSVHMSGPARILLDNLRPSRARMGVRRTLTSEELEERLAREARIRGEVALNEVRDSACEIAASLEADEALERLDRLISALMGAGPGELHTAEGRARRARMGYDPDRLVLLEALRADLASHPAALRGDPADPQRLFAFFEAYFSNWIEGTEFGVAEAEEIVFEGRVPPERPADAHDVLGTFDAVTDGRLRASAPEDADALEDYVLTAHRRVMAARPGATPGEYKQRANRAGGTYFVHPDLVRGTLREGFSIMRTLAPGLARATFAMFLVSEVHPFVDGNGRVARLLMNAELSAVGSCRIMIPLSYRDEYVNALRALSRRADPIPLRRALDRGQHWAALMEWSPRTKVMELMQRTNALVTPEEVVAANAHLLDPS